MIGELIVNQVEQKSAMIAQLHREAVEMKVKAEKDLAEAKEIQADLLRREEEVKNGIFLFYFIFLFCFVLFVLFCFVLFCFVLFCFVLFCFVLFCFVLFCFVLFCFVLFCSNLIFITERKVVQKERVDSVKERRKLVDEIKDSTQAMLQQNQNMRAQTPSPSSLPECDNKENVS